MNRTDLLKNGSAAGTDYRSVSQAEEPNREIHQKDPKKSSASKRKGWFLDKLHFSQLAEYFNDKLNFGEKEKGEETTPSANGWDIDLDEPVQEEPRFETLSKKKTALREKLDHFAMAALVRMYQTGRFVQVGAVRIRDWSLLGLEHMKGFIHYRRWRKAGGSRQNAEIGMVPTPAREVVEKFERLERAVMTSALSFLTGIPKEKIALRPAPRHRSQYLRAFAKRCTTVFIPAASVLLLCAVLYSIKDYTLGVKVYLEGREVATLKSQEEYREVSSRVERYVSGITGGDYELGVEPTYQVALVNKKEFSETLGLEQALLATADDVIGESCGLYIDGELVAVNADRYLLEKLLGEALDVYRDGEENESASVEFVQDVRIESGLYARKLERSLDEIRLLLNPETKQESLYEVQSGDLLSTIAPKFDMSVAQLKALNPDVSERRLQVGTQLVVAKAVSPLTVKAMRTVTFNESIPYKTEVIKDDSKYVSETTVKTPGVEGIVAVTSEVCEIDGVEISRLETGREVISEPTTQIEVRGTKPTPKTAPSGSFRCPVTGGVVTSRFGARKRGYHTGIDIGLPRGTSIVAADGGTVTYSGWKSSYGYIVKISHGNNTETWYAHCSALLVSAGQQVSKGQPIARVGSTGNSTGPHLHFEIRINGTAVNPAPYIGK
ncbi:MAG: peptidoglycan DD-metalloendopeptidase family protein [Clostridia bacterium]|nr:peptidoglycan DD-metalloendopeptidase family protein [Clostridia bacterium]